MYYTYNAVFLSLWVMIQMWVATLFQVGDKSLSVIYLILTHCFDKLNKNFFFVGGGKCNHLCDTVATSA